MRRTAAALVCLLGLYAAACAPAPPLPDQPRPAGADIGIEASPVPLDATAPDRVEVDGFRYAGGLKLDSRDTSRLHGLSDLNLDDQGTLEAVTDEGDLLTAQLVLSTDGRPVALRHARLAPLRGPDGRVLPSKEASDAEGLVKLANGDRLVSFERDHRIWLYPASGGPPRAAPAPVGAFPPNGGFEAMSAYAAAGPDAYLVGAEESGQVWVCRLSLGCTEQPGPAKEQDFGLVAIAPLPDGAIAYLLRAWDPIRGSRVQLSIERQGRPITRLTLARPLTVDNLEGLTVVPRANGELRFYLLSDDNFSPRQQTLLLGFDWRPRG